MTKGVQAKKPAPKNYQGLFTGLTVLLFIQAPFVVLMCLFAMSSFSRVTWMDQGILSIIAVLFMITAIIAPIASLIWVKQKELQKTFVRSRLVLLLLTTGPFVALVVTQILGTFFSASVSGNADTFAYMRIISTVASTIVAIGALAYTAGTVGIVALAVTTYWRKTYGSK